MTDLLPGFDDRTVETGDEVAIRVRTAGPSRPGARGRPVLLLHGHPQTLSTWHAVAPALAEGRGVVTSTEVVEFWSWGGGLLQEERPAEVLAELRAFLAGSGAQAARSPSAQRRSSR